METKKDNYICIGDPHGRADLLSALFNKIDEAGYWATHRLVFMGDMIDRGFKSAEVIKMVRSACDNAGAIALRGNHEDMMLDWVRFTPGDAYSMWWVFNGGDRTASSYGADIRDFADVIKQGPNDYDWIKSLPLFYETDRVFFSHAPVPIYTELLPPPFRTNAHTLTWTYFEPHEEETLPYDHGKIAVCGHMHAVARSIWTPRVTSKLIYADTGAGCHKLAPLSGVIITDGKYEGYVQSYPKESQTPQG
jgi:hypothetical protein